MKKIISIIAIGSTFLLFHCTVKKKSISGLWFYTHSTNGSQGEETEITPAGFINLQPDGSYSRDFGSFDYGDWEKKDTSLILKSFKGKSFVFPIKDFYGKELKLFTAKGTVINFESQPGRFSSESDNPFSIENNSWRLPAAKSETDKELRKRLKNHFKFHEVYFRWALEEGFESVDVRGTPSLIRIYGNGFALKEFGELPAAWRSYFYDEADCRKANAIVKNMFDTNDIAWSNTDNRFKMFISAFQQLQQKVK